MNKKGLAEISFAAFLALVVAGIAQTGVLFGGGGVGAVIGSSFLVTAATGSALSTNLESSVKPFREKRAVEICEFSGGTDCQGKVAAMSKDEILDYIDDDSPAGTGFYAPAAVARTGGGLRARILALQR
jgi:hypothetical protein